MSLFQLARKAAANPKRAITVASEKVLGVVGHRNYRRFIVLTRSRTGSNMLTQLLNSHPSFSSDYEVFRELGGKDYRDILNRTYSKQAFYIKAKGFKIFYYHPLDAESCGIWDELTSMEGLHVIHLKRRNVLKTFVSRKIAEEEGVWAIDKNRPRSESTPVTVSFTVEELRGLFEQTRSWEEWGDRTFGHQPLLSIDYEDLMADQATVFGQVTEFLGGDFQQPETRMRKQNTRTMRDTIDNYDDLKSALAGTELGKFFSE